ncbi:phosphoglycerate kinase [Candidatus Uhrbacteria bacterium]|nr:phosphoglycerate kinase [Candidatus Uhrbacteria bacterium]
MQLRTWTAKDIRRGAKVLLRIDANVALHRGRAVVGTHDRIAKTLPEIARLRDRGAAVILMTHFGRPRGVQTEFSVAPLARAIGAALGTRVARADDVVGKDAKRHAADLQPGEVMMVENLRFDRREEQNDDAFARALAALGDVYVNNAFGVCHRAHASVAAMTRHLPSFAGSLVAEEVKQLTKPMKKPFVLVVGGNKLETKVPLLLALGKNADAVFLGSGLMSAFNIVCPAADAEMVVRTLKHKIRMPRDLRCDRHGAVIDVGRETEQSFAELLHGAKTIVWNGPLGITERTEGESGTRAFMKALGAVKGARIIVGGGETVDVMAASPYADKVALLSTGGGAMLAFLAGEDMPGLAPLVKK